MKTLFIALLICASVFAQKNIDNYNLDYYQTRLLLAKETKEYKHVDYKYYECPRCGVGFPKHETCWDEYRCVEVLCRLCFNELRPKQRLPYYWRLFVFWNWLYREEGNDPSILFYKWNKIREAVLEGK